MRLTPNQAMKQMCQPSLLLLAQMKTVAKFSIRFYQKFVSPYKEFRCAYGIYYGNGSCSCEILKIISNESFCNWLPKIMGQFSECKKRFCYSMSLIKSGEKKTPQWCDCYSSSSACDIFDIFSVAKKSGCRAIPRCI